MAGTNAAAAKKALIDALAGLAGLTGVQVVYSLPRDVERECIYGGVVAGPVELAAMAGGSRIRRVETPTLNLHIRVAADGEADAETTETRACALGAHVENYVAANPTLGGVAGLKLAAVVAMELDSGPDDDGYLTVLSYQILLRSYLE